MVQPGDLVMADHDGVVVILQPVAAEVVEHAEAKVAIEKQMRYVLDGGALVSDAFRQFGVLRTNGFDVPPPRAPCDSLNIGTEKFARCRRSASPSALIEVTIFEHMR